MVDQYREEIEEALGAGASVAAVARALGLADTTVRHALLRWKRPARPQPGAEALERLRELVK